MTTDKNELLALLPRIAAQARNALANLRLAEMQAVPAERRERNPELDWKAASLDRSYYQLLRLINNLSLTASLAEGRKMRLQDRDLVNLVGTQCERAAGLAELLGLQVRFVCVPDRHLCAVDSDTLEQLLYQLLSNAFKFTPAGGTVTVELRVVSGYVHLSVEDTGPGIPDGRLPSAGIPELPSQGAGLGLFLCRQLANTLGGTLLAESKAGRGSRFTLSLPDRRSGTVSDLPFDYSGGFNRALLGLADALPAEAFLLRSQE